MFESHFDPGALRTAAAAGFFVAALLMTLLAWRGI